MFAAFVVQTLQVRSDAEK